MTMWLADGRVWQMPLGFVEGYEVISKRMNWDTSTDHGLGDWYWRTQGQANYRFQPWLSGGSNEWFLSRYEEDYGGIGWTNTIEVAQSVWQPGWGAWYPEGWALGGGWEPGGAVPMSGRGLGLGKVRCSYEAWGVMEMGSGEQQYESDGELTFWAPLSCGEGATVLLTLEGVDYRRRPGAPLDLSKVKLWGQEPVSWSNEIGEVSYLVRLDAQNRYSFGPDAFEWPSDSWTECEAGDDWQRVETWHADRLWFTGFHNQQISVIVEPDTTPFELWYFEGQKTKNYPVKARIKARMSNGASSDFIWSKERNSDVFDIDLGFFGGFFDSTTATIKSKNKSISKNDCRIKVTSKKYPTLSATYDFTVDYFMVCVPNGNPTHKQYTIWGFHIYMSDIPYKCTSKFQTVHTGEVWLELNEKFTGHQNYGGSDWGMPLGADGPDSWIDPNNIVDHITPPGTGNPAANYGPLNPLSSILVDDYDGEWRVGSQIKGKGTTVLQKKWKRYIDHGEHQCE